MIFALRLGTYSFSGGRLSGSGCSSEGSKGINKQGSGNSSASAIASITLRDGFALPLVRSDMKDIDTPERRDSSCLVISRSFKMRNTLLLNMELYNDQTLFISGFYLAKPY